MQVTETLSDGLKRQLSIVIPGCRSQQEARCQAGRNAGQGADQGLPSGQRYRCAHLKRLAGKQEMAQIIDTSISEAIREVVAERKERPALNPDIALR